MIQIGEYAIALALLVFALIGFVLQITQWGGVSQGTRLTNVIKAAACLLVFASFIYFAGVVVKTKGEKAWSNWLVKEQLLFSFVFIKPGVWLNSSTWAFLVEHRGAQPVYNVDIWFIDLDRQEAFRDLERRNMLPSDDKTKAEMMSGDSTRLAYPEIDPGSGIGVARQFFWRPLRPERERFQIRVAYRGGRVDQILRIEKVGNAWGYATRVKELNLGKILIECKDAILPADKEWAQTLPPCFPSFGAGALLSHPDRKTP